ncbi:hypothetical protein L3Y34_016201 [Caenorhabditis briggsae]|uniref:Uncharacterized protein n=1 Tax=Caenorhabditis briggsae TaxID=6238 RepID=A0AAE9J0T5_CAEBR|nr:hypothetical protein L3Y34_016201 [Caenorhabditis briggsae]
MNGIENFVNARAPPQASISFEVISEETCDPPTTEGEILTEQPIKLWVTKEKMFPKLDSATTHFVFIVSTDLALGPMSPLPTKKGALFSKGMDTDMASETQRRVIRQMLAATGTSQLAQYVKEGRCHIIVASHQDESRDPTDAPKSRTCSENVYYLLKIYYLDTKHSYISDKSVHPNFDDRVLPYCEDFYNRITAMFKPKEYNKMFVELEDFDAVTIADSLTSIIHRNFKRNPLLKKWRTSKPSQGAALFFRTIFNISSTM